MIRTPWRAALAAVAVLSSLVAVPVAAQDDDDDRLPRRVPAPGAMDAEEVFSIVTARRARLGLKVNLQARETDSIGAYVEGVTPGGPAEKAGIRSGDVISRLDGTALVGGNGARRNADGGRSLPGLRLIELAAQLEPNDTVTVELRRGDGWKERRTVRLVTASEPAGFALRGRPGEGRDFLFRFGPDGPEGWREGEFERLPWGAGELPRMRMFFGSPLGQLELASLNEDLGRYFGTDEGVLVISAPKDSKLNLRGGDVVLAVDGRKPSSPSHLLRILRSYEGGEQIRLEIMRNRRRETITATLEPSPARRSAIERGAQPIRRRSSRSVES